jgi:hypothetical protein
MWSCYWRRSALSASRVTRCSLKLAGLRTRGRLEFTQKHLGRQRRKPNGKGTLMDPTTIAALGFGGLFVLLAIRMPVGAAMMLIGTLGI